MVVVYVHTMAIKSTTNASSEISDRVSHLKDLLKNNLKVLKDIIEIDEDSLWCEETVSNSPEQKPEVELETCPIQKEKLPVCYKHEEVDQNLQLTAETLNDVESILEPIKAVDPDLENELNYAYLLEEYKEMKELCKQTVTSYLKKLCKDLDANMQRLFKLHDHLQDLQRQSRP